ncbi:putative C2orf56-like protein [Roseibium sp. TrichSKD4]|uniref:class I SAM-dependent methyltransferase n=1 Tax=Roseibium sp. TrichSKD4 TaxID=744980 RepID=UPI0001E56830|nr:class I SAM-dependent methyltransferase [Roseibium sp. TrichSKD4]EFO31761.1 putative C2orf56-like protein [Roseibium sp. TrichSKD4]
MTTPLLAKLKKRIVATGPLSVVDYMSACLADPDHGYYTTKEPFGEMGDFTTAPEVSQMFGELLGAFCLQASDILQLGEPFQLVELGPGGGTLMADFLRMAALQPGFMENAQLNLVEMSPRLREKQADTLKHAPLAPTFRDMFSEVPDGPLIVIANEFFDALPIRQFIKTELGWSERMVGLNDEGNLSFGIGVAQLEQSALPAYAAHAHRDAVLETQPAANAIASQIAERITRFGGLALFIDYGYTKSALGDTLQALYKHAYDDVFAHPGAADITAHVNFEALARSAAQAGAHVHAPLTQGDFLVKLGLLERAGALGYGKDPKTQECIRDAVERLAAPDQMGDLFKVLAITHKPLALPPFDLLWHPI